MLSANAEAPAADADADGICDDVDDCVGALDEWVCNGDDTSALDATVSQAAAELDDCGVCGGDNSSCKVAWMKRPATMTQRDYSGFV